MVGVCGLVLIAALLALASSLSDPPAEFVGEYASDGEVELVRERLAAGAEPFLALQGAISYYSRPDNRSASSCDAAIVAEAVLAGADLRLSSSQNLLELALLNKNCSTETIELLTDGGLLACSDLDTATWISEENRLEIVRIAGCGI